MPHQTSITKDNAPISIDFLWYYKVLTRRSRSCKWVTLSRLRRGSRRRRCAIIGGIPLDDVLSEREHINNMLRTRLDEVTERWGVKVTNVEIREIIPAGSSGCDEPPDVCRTHPPGGRDRIHGDARSRDQCG